MIDTHCHLLPGLDDGPTESTGSLALARSLAEQGVTHVVATPHVSRQFPTEAPTALRRAEELRGVLASADVALTLSVSAEFAPAQALSASADELAVRAANGHVIVEAEPRTSVGAMATVADHIASSGLRPVLAHPERCRALRRDGRAIELIRSSGALIQIVAPSLAGEAGPEIAEYAWRLIDDGSADLVASDAHDIARRRPLLGSVGETIERRCGGGARQALLVEGPRRLAPRTVSA